MESAMFEAERLEEERLEADAEDIEDAEFREPSEEDELDSPGSLRDFVVPENEEAPEIGSPHASAFSDDSDSLPGRPYAKLSFAQKRKRVVTSDDEDERTPSPPPRSPSPPPLATPRPSPTSVSSQNPTLSQAYTPSVPHNNAVQPFENLLFETVRKGPQAKVLARIRNKYDQFRIFSLMQDLWTVALNYTNNVGRTGPDLSPRGTSVTDFLQRAQELANLMRGLEQDTMPEEAFAAQNGVRMAYKAFDPTPTEEEEAEEAGSSKKKRGNQEGKDRLRLIAYIQTQLFVKDYRFKDGACWQRVRIGRTMSAYWEEVATVEEFIFSTLGDPLCPEVFRLTFMKRDKAWTLDTYINLSRNCSLAFPTLSPPSRYVFAFRNGIYISRVKPELVKPAFLEYDEAGALLLTDLFVPIKDTHRVLTEQTVACKYFEYDFDLAAHDRCKDIGFSEWTDVDESLRHMLEYQRLP